ncbi:MAG TPA: RNA methyltransferase [Acidimicrobiales bacterium]|nr:RNA methyltransferase [Acidimicrobiales bacterium]
MAEPIAVDDPRDARLADYVGLTDAALRRRVEHGRGLFIAEGELVIRQLLVSPYPVRSVLVAPTRYAHLRDVLDGLDAPVYVAPKEVLEAVAGFDIHRGAVASAGRLPYPEPSALLRGARTVAVLEALNDHENIGALFRNAAALGVDAVFLSPTCADPLYRRSVRVSMGCVLRLPFTTLSPWPDALAGLAAAGFELVALTPAPGAEDLGEFPPGGRVALLFGAERDGLSPGALAAASRRARIPVRDGVDSLNVATAAAIAFHHFCGAP